MSLWRAAFAVAVLLSLCRADLEAAAQGEQRLTLYDSSSLNGNLDGCRCASGPRAGLLKRAHYLRSKVDRRRSLLVDGGDLFAPYPNEPLAREILEAYQELGCDAIGVGDQELTLGAQALLDFGEAYPFVVHNLQICPDATRCVLFSPAPTVVRRAGLTVGLLSLIDPQVFALYRSGVRALVRVAPPKEAAPVVLERLAESKPDLVILLYHGCDGAAEEVLRSVTGIDVAVVTHDQRLIAPRKVGRSVLVSPGEEGNRLGVLELFRTRGGPWRSRNSFVEFSYERSPEDGATRARVERCLEALGRGYKGRFCRLETKAACGAPHAGAAAADRLWPPIASALPGARRVLARDGFAAIMRRWRPSSPALPSTTRPRTSTASCR